ncbi:MAG TPA: hydroxymethylbilane synthase [Acidimicrobiales bacterium]|nr:hydroxymethylbilane synthase [Acidimicrobiales bacterium]
MTTVRLVSRKSPLALVQARRVGALIEALDPGFKVEIVTVETRGDVRPDLPISTLGSQGVFVAEVERAVLEGAGDIAVHSAKDLPSSAPELGLVLAAVPERADARDALIGNRLYDLAAGAVVATGAVRRRAQLASVRPDLCFTELRGNIGTRLDKVPEGGAAVVALAAIERLGLTDRVTEVLSSEVMLSQVGQGALALRCREDDTSSLELCAALDDPVVSRAVRSERSFLATLGGGCDAPVAAFARCDDFASPIQLEAMIASEDGHVIVRGSLVGTDPESLGAALAEHLLSDSGGRALLNSSAARR